MTFSLLGSFALQLKTLLLLLGETFRCAKVMNFSRSNENFAQRKFRLAKFRPLRYAGSRDNCLLIDWQISDCHNILSIIGTEIHLYFSF